MSPCISIYLINKSDLRTEKIDSVINSKLNIGEIKWIRKGGLDEFDTVGLGKYRNNNDF
jgi:hypothetical protein